MRAEQWISISYENDLTGRCGVPAHMCFTEEKI